MRPEAPPRPRLALPLFPLNTVLFPGGLLPLRIFEQRYLEMTKICLRDSVPFGVCRIREGSEAGAPALPDLVGCSAHISDWEMPHQGIFHLLVRGECRFRIISLTTSSDGLIRAEVELLEEISGTISQDTFAYCRHALEDFVANIGMDALPSPVAFENPRWTGYRLAELLPLGLDQRQRLLETSSDADRLQRLYVSLTAAD